MYFDQVNKSEIVLPTNKKSRILKIVECARFLEYHGLKKHVQFIAAAIIHHSAFLKLTEPNSDEALKRLISDRPQYLWLLTVPYIDARWSSSIRVDRLIEHASALRGQLSKYDFSVSQSLRVLDLAELSIPNYSIVIDKPISFRYEGLITLNLFQDNLRFFSITFSFYYKNRIVGMIVGGIQGCRADGILAQYRNFTKLAHGLRPRDFLFEVLRVIARAENVQQIVAVPDRYRYHRHGYFAPDERQGLHLNYDDVWKDRGGVLNDDGMYEIPLTSERRLSRVAAKKRRMYRSRYDLLDKLAAGIVPELQRAVPTICEPAQ